MALEQPEIGFLEVKLPQESRQNIGAPGMFFVFFTKNNRKSTDRDLDFLEICAILDVRSRKMKEFALVLFVGLGSGYILSGLNEFIELQSSKTAIEALQDKNTPPSYPTIT